MDPTTVKLLAYVAAIIASPTVVVASVRAILLFGKLSQAVDSLNAFARAATGTLTDHGERIAALEGAAGEAPVRDRPFSAYDRRSS